MKVNDTYEVRIIDNDINGNVPARINNFVFIIKFYFNSTTVIAGLSSPISSGITMTRCF